MKESRVSSPQGNATNYLSSLIKAYTAIAFQVPKGMLQTEILEEWETLLEADMFQVPKGMLQTRVYDMGY